MTIKELTFKHKCHYGRSHEEARTIEVYDMIKKNFTETQKEELSDKFCKEIRFNEDNNKDYRSGMWMNNIIKSFRIKKEDVKNNKKTYYFVFKNNCDYYAHIWMVKPPKNNDRRFIYDFALKADGLYAKYRYFDDEGVKENEVKVNCKFNDEW